MYVNKEFRYLFFYQASVRLYGVFSTFTVVGQEPTSLSTSGELVDLVYLGLQNISGTASSQKYALVPGSGLANCCFCFREDLNLAPDSYFPPQS